MKNSDSESKNENFKDSINSEEDDNSKNINEEELIEQLGILNLSLDTLYVIITALILNIEFVVVSREKLLDQINNTSNAKDAPDVSKIPRISNLMIIYSAGIFLMINLQRYLEIINNPNEEVEPKAKRRAWKAFISSFLVYIAASIRSDNIEV